MPIYEPIPLTGPLTQGDVIDGCPVFMLLNQSGGADRHDHPIRRESRVIILTQACDLAQAKADRVVVALVYAADELVSEGAIKASLIRDQLRRGQVYGWYFLPAVPEPLNLPESLINLRDLHTVSRPVLDHLVAQGQGVCRLLTPYREHLAQHFAVTYMRIGLPQPYATN
jgi:hypothetical protein